MVLSRRTAGVVLVALLAASPIDTHAEKEAQAEMKDMNDDDYTVSPVEVDDAWGYAAPQYDPKEWGKIRTDRGEVAFPLCGTGRKQSPIDVSSHRVQSPRRAADPKGSVKSGTIGDVIEPPSGGEPVLLDVTQKHGAPVYSCPEGADCGKLVTEEGGAFDFVSMHFHAPSENTVDGKQYPLELHMVHADEEGKLAVLGVLYEFGEADPDRPNQADVLLSAADADGGEPVRVDMAELYDAGSGFWRWEGSLTTPPCTEGVLWTLQAAVETVSAEDAAKFKKHIGGFPGNARPTQPLHGRQVALFQGDDA